MSGDGQNPLIWNASCRQIQRRLYKCEVIFCRNLFAAWGTYPPWHMTCCGNCYMRHSWDKFPSNVEVEDSNNQAVDNEHMHHWVRPGEHLMKHFQYEVCHFSHFQVRNPMYHKFEDDILICEIMIYYLGDFWFQRPGTVKKHLLVSKQIHEVGMRSWYWWRVFWIWDIFFQYMK